jgi:tetratricopeptide (TPR) repeat protein
MAVATTFEALAIAVQHHQAGRLRAAEQIYRQILAIEPNHVDALHLLGVIANEVGEYEIAVEYIGRAIGLKQTDAAFHSNLGNAFKGQGKLDEAVACYRRALELQPNLAEVHHNLANVFKDQGRLDEAVAHYHRALELCPDYPQTYGNLGNVLTDQRKLNEAVACYRRALELKPDDVAARNNLGIAFQELGKLDEAVACYRRALELKPEFAEVHINLGNVFKGQGKLDEAAACYRRALELKPEFAEAHNNLGTVFQIQGKLDEAAACYGRAVELKPEFAEAHKNLGLAFQGLGRLDEAIARYRRALELKPDFPEAHMSLALAWLLTGNWQRGWPEYEWRWQTKNFAPRPFRQPMWDGKSLGGKTILLHAEQALGDTIQFIRYASIVKQHGATVIVECPQPLLELLEGCPGVDQLIGHGKELPAFDVHAPLLSVPGILQTSIESIPASVPYLLSKPAIAERWRQRLSALHGFKIGIHWRGRPGLGPWCRRDIPLALFSSLAAVPNVQWISLQKGATSDELAPLRDRLPILDFADDLDRSGGAFVDTAAVMANLDLVITSDTAAAHLAGALGVSVWVALPFAPDWRWLLDRSDSPWYPTMRLFRQTQWGNWHTVFEEITKALCARLQSSTADGAR